jgi:hypothetical protein
MLISAPTLEARGMSQNAAAVAVEKRRQNWTTRQWRSSERGNSFTNVRGFNITVFGSRKGYGIKIEQRYGERCQFGKQRYATRAEACAAAFTALIWAEQAWGGNGRWQ